MIIHDLYGNEYQTNDHMEDARLQLFEDDDDYDNDNWEDDDDDLYD